MTLGERLRAAIGRKRHAYQATFRNPAAERVLLDLAKFCRAHESTAHPDSHIAARLDGRREVWLRIQQQLQLSPRALWELHPAARDPVVVNGDSDDE